MSKYREALFSITFTMHHRVKPKYLSVCEDENLETLRELVEKDKEFQSRKEKLIVGSEWECVSQCLAERVAMLQCYTRIMNIDNMVTIAEFGCEYVNFRLLDTNAPLLFTTPKDQFLLCFKPNEG